MKLIGFKLFWGKNEASHFKRIMLFNMLKTAYFTQLMR